MGLLRCTSTDAFVVTDLDDAPAADGVVRCARKVLVDGARTLARSRTYAWALLGRQVSGASAGVNAEGADRAAALAAFVEELAPTVASGALSLDAAKGVDPGELAGLAAVDVRSGLRLADGTQGPLADELLAEGLVAAMVAALGGLEGRTVALEGAGAAGPAVVRAVDAAGGRVAVVATSAGAATVGDRPAAELATAWAEQGDAVVGAGAGPAASVLTEPADVLCCGSRVGLVDHEVAASLPHRLVVPLGPVPVTARGLAVAGRRGAVVLPDFLTTAGPLLAARPDDDDATPASVAAAVRDRVGGLAAEVVGHPESAFLGACELAEAHLRTWRDAPPFGRPLA